jgi:hypothetical protein
LNIWHGKGMQIIFLIQLTENVGDIMRDPERVLNSLAKQSKISMYRFERLYRILFNKEIYYVACQKPYAKEGNMSHSVDGKTIDDMSIFRIKQLIKLLKSEQYQPISSK